MSDRAPEGELEPRADNGATATHDSPDAQQATRRARKPRHRAVPLMPEVRHWAATGLEVRSASKTDEIVITGSPIVYDTPYTVCDMFGEFEERMAPGVAGDVLERGADVRFLFNHDGLPLARSTSGTLKLTDGASALQFEARLDARQQLANDLAIAIERGDVSQMSCGFIVARDEWDDAQENRTIHQFADLLDVSAVTYPASPTTSIAVATRMALAVPVESRARLRRIVTDVAAGKPLTPEQIESFRAMLAVDLDSGEPTRTPGGTGRLGNPAGNGKTYGSLGDGTEAGMSGTDMASATQDGTGSRSADEELETTEAETPKTSRAAQLRVKRALRGL